METRGVFAPTTREEAIDRYEAVGSAARVIVRETAKAMEFDADEYAERVTPAVVETARDAAFAELLVVHLADRDEFDGWLEASEFDPDAVVELGSEHVDRVAWHPVPFAGTVVATTFQDRPDAAASTLRRNAFGRVYRDVFDAGDEGGRGSEADE
ncbi:hypothetical protein DQW50_10725 [Halorubrum sp. 48-1-W]|uniref:DUF5809 family protein n=1 Tax=Halorubrum sp. 48-1-W TaxID=2249761 RepID=UPI000DCC0669|nr:DUF5809 family protein [Halorubrum sp. 48-1-W]RAW45109.1 hypothetical protein DQW50_10725 [Halorubrum sp. 48-1-W]